jgi:hypothetical protein
MSVAALQPEALIAIRTDLGSIFVSIAKPNEFDWSSTPSAPIALATVYPLPIRCWFFRPGAPMS